MSKQSNSDHPVLVDLTSESDWEHVDGNNDDYFHNDHYFYTDNYTARRPPHLNNRNFSSTQPTGSNTQPRVFEMPQDLNLEHVTNDMVAHRSYARSSTNTESTLKDGDPFVKRPYLQYYVNRNYSYEDGTPQPTAQLTEQAIAAHDHSNEVSPYDGNVYKWLPGTGHNFHTNAANDWSTGNLMPTGPRSHISLATSMSWTVLPTAQDQFTSGIICGAGGWQSDIPADPKTTWARSIRDEDIHDANLIMGSDDDDDDDDDDARRS
ncbi:hypothetical protein F4677DRAFT_246869 [Hypoxylon crocopeplum]|nr:hypothetical protein F4677DRAFT_246869 [Hypoxylon crocopeplum]